MSSDCLKMAADGWYIISRHSETRVSARKLLRWLADRFEANSAEIRFLDDVTGYAWQETVERIPECTDPRNEGIDWDHPFPEGESSWHFEGFPGNTETAAVILDLFADQLLYVNLGASDNRVERRLLKNNARSENVNPAWTAVSRSSRVVLSRLYNLSHSRNPLLLLGENGVGKSYAALLIHRTGPEPSLPFEKVGCPAKNGGPERTGTLMVENWHRLDSDRQRKFLNDSRRLIAAAEPGMNCDEIRKNWNRSTGGRGLILAIPPLRSRRDDIPMLAGQFLDSLTVDSGFELPELSPTAVEALKAYSWTGNVRELKETVSWALKRCESMRIGVGDLPPAVRGALRKPAESSFPDRLVALEYEVLREELIRQRGNMTRTAKALGLTPRQVSWRVKKYGIDPGDFKPRRTAGR